MEEQEEGPVDHSYPSCSIESLPSEDSRQEVVKGSHQSEESNQGTQNYDQETEHRASLKENSGSFSGHS